MAKKNNNQVSAVRQAKHGWIWTLAFTVISILWIAPILVVLLNSFKRKAFIFRHPFTLGTEPLSAGWDKFFHGVERACLKIKAFLLKEFKRTTRMGAIHKMLITVNASVQIQPCFA